MPHLDSDTSADEQQQAGRLAGEDGPRSLAAMRLLALLCLLASSACADEIPPACWTWTERPPHVCLVAPPGWLVRDGWHAVAEVCAPDAAALRRKAAELRLPVCGE